MKISPLHKANNVDFKPYYPGARKAVQRDGRYSVMEDDILISIKKRYCTLRNNHQKHFLCHLKRKEAFELSELVGDDNAKQGINGKQVSITYRNLFDGDYATVKPAVSSDLKTLLVQGEPGVGKTTLCMSILEDWATGNLFQEFQLLLFLPLRVVASTSSLLELLSMIYPDFDSSTCAKVATYLKENGEHNILIVTDGWEDLEVSQRQMDSFFHSLLFSKNIIPTKSVTVLITTALPSCIQIHTLELIDRFITLTRFNIIAMETVIHSEFDGDVIKIRYLIAQMNNNQLLARICSTPLTLAILCDHCRSSSDAEPLPNTMTRLYAKLVWTITTVNVSHTSAYTLNLSKYDDLPEGLRKPWQLLCELAFRKVEKGSDALSQSNTFKYMSSELKAVSYFGLIKPVSQTGDTVYFTFLHPCFEKYLASLHLVSQLHEVQLTLMRGLSVNDNHIFWLFFVSNYADMVDNVNTDIIVELIKIMSVAYGSNKGSLFVELCHLAFEATNSVVNDQVIKAMHAMDKKTLKFGHCCSAYDCEAMIYMIENITQECKIEINFQDCCISPELVNRLANALGSETSVVQVEGLNLSGNRLNLSGDQLNSSLAVDFFSRAAAAFKHLRILILRKCEIGTSCFDIKAILDALTESSCQTLIHLDLSLNLISMSFLQALQCHIQSNTTFDRLEILGLKGSFKSGISMKFLVSFSDTLASRCNYLRQLDLSDNNLGEPGNPDLRNMISRLLSLGRDFNLCLSDKYMTEVNNEFIYVMEETIKNKGTINHTIAHGVIVGPGRSGKNTLMSRLIGNKPPDPNMISPSTGVLENIIKVEVKKISTVAAAVSNLEWMKLEHDEEALELIMTTARNHSAVARLSKPISLKYILKENEDNVVEGTDSEVAHPPTSLAIPKQRKLKQKILKLFKKLKHKSYTKKKKSVDEDKETERSSYAIVYRPDVEPVDIFKRAMELRGMDALREHLESSWSLYLTNTGGQIEFQEHLPLLVCGPSIFFVTFPLHHDLEKPYDVRYEYADGRVKKYKSPGTLLEELLQTLATINASNFTSGQQRNSKVNKKPKIFFVGTHKDLLSSDIAEETIQEKDRLLQIYVRQTSLFREGSIQFAEAPKRLMFAVNNLSSDDEEFHKIRSAVQQTVEKTGFTVECPSSWLILSLILRAKHKSDQVLSFEKCFSIAQQCGIMDRNEFNQALSFIHSRLGLIRYFNTDDLNNLVVIDPQILFDRITDLTVATFTDNNVEVNQMEDFQVRGIIPLAVMQEISDKDHSDSKLPFMWLTKLLNYLRIAALFADISGDNYFFPSALCHAPELHSDRSCSNLWPRLLIGFESGFCPRGIPGALIKYLMTNEMQSSISWNIIPNRIFRNQVSFAIQAHEIITLKIFPTHLEISCETEEGNLHSDSEADSTGYELIRKTGKMAYEQIGKAMITVTSQCNECSFFWGFYCTLTSKCEVQHPAKIEWDENNCPFKVVCNIANKRGNLPKDYEIWSLVSSPNQGKIQLLYKEIDAYNKGVPKHLGQIADSMTEWKGRISEVLQLTPADVASIEIRHPNELRLQARDALQLWKQKLGSDATYQKLIDTFEGAGYRSYADKVRDIVSDVESRSNMDQHLPPQPMTYPHPNPEIPSCNNFLRCRSLSCDEFLQIDEDAAQNLSESDVFTSNVLNSCNVSIVPSLSSKQLPADSDPLYNLDLTENHHGWFFGKMTHLKARNLLMTVYNPHGSYLVRNSETNPGQYVLSLRDGRTARHYRIKKQIDGAFFLQGDGGKTTFKTIVELISHYQQNAKGLPVRLIHPCIILGEHENADHQLAQKWEIDRRRIKHIQKQWEGEFSAVWEGLLDENKPVAITTRSPEMTRLNFLQMMSIMIKLHNHPRLAIYLCGVCTKEEPMYIITEPLEFGSLLDYLHKKSELPPSHLLIDVSSQVAEGMMYLEEQNCVHRNLKAKNILIKANNPDLTVNCKIANFERAKMIGENNIFEAAHNETWTTYKWTAPEAAIQKKYSIKSDVWSFGIVLYEIITSGRSPYPGMADAVVLKKVQQGYRMPQPHECPLSLYHIMRDCWHIEPWNRPTFTALQWELKTFLSSETNDSDPLHAIFANPAEVLRAV